MGRLWDAPDGHWYLERALGSNFVWGVHSVILTYTLSSHLNPKRMTCTESVSCTLLFLGCGCANEGVNFPLDADSTDVAGSWYKYPSAMDTSITLYQSPWQRGIYRLYQLPATSKHRSGFAVFDGTIPHVPVWDSGVGIRSSLSHPVYPSLFRQLSSSQHFRSFLRPATGRRSAVSGFEPPGDMCFDVAGSWYKYPTAMETSIMLGVGINTPLPWTLV